MAGRRQPSPAIRQIAGMTKYRDVAAFGYMTRVIVVVSPLASMNTWCDMN
jgi:hypothetical protein